MLASVSVLQVVGRILGSTLEAGEAASCHGMEFRIQMSSTLSGRLAARSCEARHLLLAMHTSG